MKPSFEVSRMSGKALWRLAFSLLMQAGPLLNQGPKDLDLTLQHLDAVLQELELREEQLSLLPETKGAGQPR